MLIPLQFSNKSPVFVFADRIRIDLYLNGFLGDSVL